MHYGFVLKWRLICMMNPTAQCTLQTADWTSGIATAEQCNLTMTGQPGSPWTMVRHATLKSGVERLRMGDKNPKMTQKVMVFIVPRNLGRFIPNPSNY